MARKIWNLVSFDLGWLACAYAAAADRSALGVFAVAALVGIHVWLVPARRREAIMIVSLALAGGLVDTILLGAGIFTFPGNMNPAFGPIFLSALYANFATTLRGCLGWMRGRWVVAAVFGALGGPLAYWGASRIGAIHLNANVWVSVVVLGVVWAVIMPTFGWLATWFHREKLISIRD